MNGKLPEKTSCKGYRHTESLQITYHPISVSPNLPIPNAPIPPVLQSPNPLSPNSKLLCTFTRSAWCMVIFPLSFSPLSPASAGMQQHSATFTGSQCTVGAVAMSVCTMPLDSAHCADWSVQCGEWDSGNVWTGLT